MFGHKKGVSCGARETATNPTQPMAPAVPRAPWASSLREHRAAQRKSWRDVTRAKTLLAPLKASHKKRNSIPSAELLRRPSTACITTVRPPQSPLERIGSSALPPPLIPAMPPQSSSSPPPVTDTTSPQIHQSQQPGTPLIQDVLSHVHPRLQPVDSPEILPLDPDIFAPRRDCPLPSSLVMFAQQPHLRV